MHESFCLQLQKSVLSQMLEHVCAGKSVDDTTFKDLCAELRVDLNGLELPKQSSAEDCLAELERGGLSLEKAATLIKSVQEIAEPMDLGDLLGRLQEVAANAACIHGKDVALLLGNTGCGKSTTVHFLGGVDFELSSDLGGQDFLKPITEVPKALECVKTSTATVSETKSINPVVLEWTSQTGQPRSLQLCDSPG